MAAHLPWQCGVPPFVGFVVVPPTAMLALPIHAKETPQTSFILLMKALLKLVPAVFGMWMNSKGLRSKEAWKRPSEPGELASRGAPACFFPKGMLRQICMHVTACGGLVFESAFRCVAFQCYHTYVYCMYIHIQCYHTRESRGTTVPGDDDAYYRKGKATRS